MSQSKFFLICSDYLEKLNNLSLTTQTTDELSFHSLLKEFLESVAKEVNSKVAFIHEPRRTRFGRPDFVAHIDGLPIGYVEAEAINANLDDLQGDAKDQNERFKANLDNFLLTNFLDFRLYREGKEVAVARLPQPKESCKLTEAEVNQLHHLLEAFFSWQGLGIGTPKELAIHLARRARQLRNETLNALCPFDPNAPSNCQHDLCGLRDAFREVLLPDLNNNDFADMFAQTVTYGLFAARCEFSNTSKLFNRSQAASLIAKSNPFLANLFHQIIKPDLDERIAWIIDDIAQLLSKADMAAILQYFGRKFSKEDPVVHFYETFLAEYDPQLREIRGVYYTPDPVVSYIVRSIDALLKKHFNMPDGLANERALILDPACGTGTFLSWVIRLVHEIVTSKLGIGAWKSYVGQRLLPRLFGFELLVAPYAIAHLKLALQLREMGYELGGKERLQIYLTNALEELKPHPRLKLGRFISNEANAAAEIKCKKPILVVLGNPPYSGHSANRSWVTEKGKRKLTWIGRLLEDYKQVNGQPLGERNPKWLQDDYVKFIRFAQWRIEKTGEGIVGFITNHAWLENPTFRGMRWNLFKAFSEIYILNLHGNVRKKEKAHDGSKDENVFDIQQGVAIFLAVKCKGETQKGETKTRNADQPTCKVFYADLWGERKSKYDYLAENDVTKTQWLQLTPTSPLYLFVPQDTNLQREYEQGFKVTEIFPVYSVGIVTARDKLTIHFTPDDVWETVKKFVRLAPEEARKEFDLGKDVRDWKVEWAQKDLREAGVPDENARKKVVPILYRPFDIRFTFYTGKSRGFLCMPRPEVMSHMLAGENWGLITARQKSQQSESWALVGVSKFIIESCAISNKTKEINYLFPLYLYTLTDQITAPNQVTDEQGRRLNLSDKFLEALAERLGLPRTEPFKLPEGITPEDIFGYIYAILHSRQYRKRYAEFLRRDFPRIPLTSNRELFFELAKLGKELVAVHLFENVPDLGYGKLEVAGSNEIERVHYDEVHQRVYINANQYFAPVPKKVWEFRIGGYQPAEKWLKDRKGRKLEFSDIEHYRKILHAIAETLRLMDKIDAQ
ncbi:MAG: N-6 DNA methylase, partial [Armatimonadetes bacterium]|nr:N-6 DNA methylase [Armatimonadota bacterium]